MSGQPLTCSLHVTHVPKSAWVELHHIQPKAMLGPDTLDNLVACCPTGHYNVHSYMSWLIFGKDAGDPEPVHTRSEKALAQQGVAKWIAAGKPGNPHAAYGIHGLPVH